MSWWRRAGGAEPFSVAPSVLAADAARLAEEVAEVEAAGADLIHFDVMDGHFVPNLTFGPHVVRALRAHTRLPLDCHLMVTDPRTYGLRFARAGADAVSFHVELDLDHAALAAELRDAGVRAGLVLNPPTPLDERIRGLLPHFDYVLIMSVHPGFGGQAFHPEVLSKLEALVRIRTEEGLELPLEIDGGISAATAGAARAAGADILVAGSAVFGTEDRKVAIAALRKAAATGLPA